MEIWVQKYEDVGLSVESRLVYQYAVMEGLKTKVYSSDEVLSGNLNYEDCDLFVGSVECVSFVLKKKKHSVPEPNYYPKTLRSQLHRNIWKTNIDELISWLSFGGKVFAKSYAWKKITGKVFDQNEVSKLMLNHHRKTTMWASEIVEWVSEYRVYVCNGEILASCIYDGDNNTKIDLAVVENAIKLLENDPQNKIAYAFDWGVLSTGETALIEMNDAWAIGAYKGIEYRDYFNFLMTRWQEMIKH